MAVLGFTLIFALLLALFGTSSSIDTITDDLEWWQKSVVYQIYPRSFQDNNGDGIGDLKGIESRINHLADIGVQAIWLSPIYESPMVDFGYDISNFTKIYPEFGTMEDFRSLISALHSKGIKLLLDFVPNHSSDQHEWFIKSKQKIDPYTDYYIWKDGIGDKPPNNWISVFEKSAWEYVPERRQYYLHSFAVVQPDLNYRNPKLRQEMMNVLKFWLENGVDGFRFDAVNFIVEDINFLDEPVISNYSVISGYPAYASLDHIYTKDQQGTYEVLREFREVLDEYKARDGKTRAMLVESYTAPEKTLAYYGNRSDPIANFPFNFDFIVTLNISSNAHDYDQVVQKWLNLPQGRWPNWVIGNHDNKRVATRFGTEVANGLNMITLLLPGTAVTYNGEEIGMVDTFILWNETVDTSGLNVGPEHYTKYSRDPERTPFQWDSSINAGFSKASKTWLPVNPNYWDLNLGAQKNRNKSYYSVYKSLTKLRTKDVFRKGDTRTHVLSDWVFSFTRSLMNETYVIIINIGSGTSDITLKPEVPYLKDDLQVYVASINSEYAIGDTLKSNSRFPMRPKSSLVLGPKSSASTALNSIFTLIVICTLISFGYRWTYL